MKFKGHRTLKRQRTFEFCGVGTTTNISGTLLMSGVESYSSGNSPGMFHRVKNIGVSFNLKSAELTIAEKEPFYYGTAKELAMNYHRRPTSNDAFSKYLDRPTGSSGVEYYLIPLEKLGLDPKRMGLIEGLIAEAKTLQPAGLVEAIERTETSSLSDRQATRLFYHFPLSLVTSIREQGSFYTLKENSVLAEPQNTVFSATVTSVPMGGMPGYRLRSKPR